MATKLPSSYSEAERNWQWPEKTWFRERLNSIKAREEQERAKLPPDKKRRQTSGNDKDREF